MSNSIFHNKAIRCTDWNQMLQLKEMAEKEGLKPYKSIDEMKERFDDDLPHYFVLICEDKFYYDTTFVFDHETELSFDQFIQLINQK